MLNAAAEEDACGEADADEEEEEEEASSKAEP